MLFFSAVFICQNVLPLSYCRGLLTSTIMDHNLNKPSPGCHNIDAKGFKQATSNPPACNTPTSYIDSSANCQTAANIPAAVDEAPATV
jgi:hypothetical protein